MPEVQGKAMTVIQVHAGKTPLSLTVEDAKALRDELNAIFGVAEIRMKSERVTFVPVFIPPVTPYVVTQPAFPPHDPFAPWCITSKA